MKNKRGQFYLLAAIIIISVIVGFAAVSNIAKKKSSVKLYDIKEELNIEGGEVLEYGEFFAENLENTINDFTDKYKEYTGEDKELVFIYGNSEEVKKISFSRETSVKSGVGESSQTTYELRKKEESLFVEPGTDKVNVTIDTRNYDFELKPGQNFFFIISQELEGETHIVKS